MTATVSGVGATGEYRSMGISGGYGSDSGPNKTSSGPHSAISGSGAIPLQLTDSGANEFAAQQKKGSKGVLVGAIIGVVALAIGAFVMRGKPAPTPPPVTASTATAPKPTVTATATPTPTAAAVPMFAKLRINTDPQDASVKEDGIEQCSSTPCEITYKGNDADPAKDHKLMFSKAGYRVETRTVKLGDSPVSVKLTKAPQYYAPPPPQPKQQQSEDKPPGFKDLPY
jgi:serine/threonine-protein kinase